MASHGVSCNLYIIPHISLIFMRTLLFFAVAILPIFTCAEETFGAYKNARQDIYFIEFIGGAGFPSLYGASLSQQNETNFAYNEGISFRWQNRELISVAGQLNHANSTYFSVFHSGASLNTTNITFYIPVEVEFKLVKNKRRVSSRILLFSGPYVGYYLGSHIKSDVGIGNRALDEFNKWDFGLESGIGFRLPIFKMHTLSNLSFKASYFRGFGEFGSSNSNYNNLFSLKMVAVNEPVSLYNHGVRLTACYELSLRKWKMTTFTAKGNGKTNFERFVVYNQ